MADPVWLLLMFDLPVKTKEQRRLASRYRTTLLDLGFNQIQLSVYAKYVINASGIRGVLIPIRNSIPPQGAVRMIKLTDDQWAGSYRFYGAQEVEVEETPTQLGLFDSSHEK